MAACRTDGTVWEKSMRVFRHASQGRYSFRLLMEISQKKHIASAWIGSVAGRTIKDPRFRKRHFALSRLSALLAISVLNALYPSQVRPVEKHFEHEGRDRSHLIRLILRRSAKVFEHVTSHTCKFYSPVLTLERTCAASFSRPDCLFSSHPSR